MGWRGEHTSSEGIADISPVSREEQLDTVGLQVLCGVLVTDEAELGDLQALRTRDVSEVLWSNILLTAPHSLPRSWYALLQELRAMNFPVVCGEPACVLAASS